MRRRGDQPLVGRLKPTAPQHFAKPFSHGAFPSLAHHPTTSRCFALVILSHECRAVIRVWIVGVDTIAQLITILMAGLGIIWHQQRTTERLRDDLNQASRELRDDLNHLRNDLNQTNKALRDDLNHLRNDSNQTNKALRDDLNQAHGELRAGVVANGQRLARIEGFLGIGVPAGAAAGAAGARAFGDQPQAVEATANP